MSKRRGKSPSRSPSATGAWLLVILGLGVVGALATYLQMTPVAREMPVNERRAERGDAKLAPEPEVDVTGKTKPTVEVFRPKYVNGELRYTVTKARPPKGANAVVFAVNEFLRATGITPANARALSCTVREGIATLEFSVEFDETYGTEDEHTIVDGILHSVAQFREIRFVQFSIRGRPMETLGNLDLSRPLPVETHRSP